MNYWKATGHSPKSPIPELHLPSFEHTRWVVIAWASAIAIYLPLFCWGLWYETATPDNLPSPSYMRRRVVMTVADIGGLALIVAYVCPDPVLMWALDAAVTVVLVAYNTLHVRKHLVML